MDSSAITLIQETAISAADIIDNKLPPHVVAIPQTQKVVDLEQYLDTRTRFRGTFETQSLPDFVAYVKDNACKVVDEAEPHARQKTEGFIDADNLRAKVFFNLITEEGNPGHGDWTGSLLLKATAAYLALRKVEGQRLGQRDLIDWLEDWGRNIVDVTADTGETMSLSATITAFRSLTIASKKDSTHVQGDRSANRTAMEEIEARAKGLFPDRITFACITHLGLPERAFVLRVGVLTDHDDPRIVLRIVQKEEHEEAIAQAFKAELEAGIAGDASLTVGSFKP